MSPLLIALFFYLTALLSTLVYALLKGGKDERSGAVWILIGHLLSQLAFDYTGPGREDWTSPEIGVMVVDGLVFAAFATIAYRSRKFWPIWAAASQLVATLTHGAVILDPSIVKTIYATAQPFWALPVLAAVAIGTRKHQKALR